MRKPQANGQVLNYSMDAFTATGLFLVLLMRMVDTADLRPEAEHIFRPLGGDIEMGFCFGADYIVVYKSGPEGYLLLGNSSETSLSLSTQPWEDLRDRVTTTNHTSGLLGLEIHYLRTSDSGIYRRECWEGRRLANQKEHLLTVCLQEASSQDVTMLPGGAADLHCNNSTAHQGNPIRWYWETYPNYTRTLLLDTGLSLEPLPETLRGQIQVRNGGSSLHIPSAVTKSRHYYCLVMEGEQCLSFQKIHLHRNEAETESIFRSVGEGVTLPCSTQQLSQGKAFWDTPFGHINQSSRPVEVSAPNRGWTYTLEVSKSGNYSLVIPSLLVRHSGAYKCISPSRVTEYALYVCPEADPVRVFFTPGDSAILRCDTNLEGPYSVQWYRRTKPEQELLILDSGDLSQPVPEELYGRVNVSHHNGSLFLFNLSPADNGEYWCVALSGFDYMDSDDQQDSEDYAESVDYPEPTSYFNIVDFLDVDDPLNGDDGVSFWDEDMVYCVVRQRTHLTLRGQDDSDDTTLYAVCAAIVGCVILGIVCAVIAVLWKNRFRRSQPGHHRVGVGTTDDTALAERLAPAENGP